MSIRLQPIVTIHITLIRAGVSFKLARHEQESEDLCNFLITNATKIVGPRNNANLRSITYDIV
jgi:hypothetical protein